MLALPCTSHRHAWQMGAEPRECTSQSKELHISPYHRFLRLSQAATGAACLSVLWQEDGCTLCRRRGWVPAPPPDKDHGGSEVTPHALCRQRTRPSWDQLTSSSPDPLRRALAYPIFTQEETEAERAGNWPKVTQVVSGKSGIQTQPLYNFPLH